MDIRDREFAGIYCKYCNYNGHLGLVCYSDLYTGKRCEFTPRYKNALEDAEKEIAALKEKAGDGE